MEAFQCVLSLRFVCAFFCKTGLRNYHTVFQNPVFSVLVKMWSGKKKIQLPSMYFPSWEDNFCLCVWVAVCWFVCFKFFNIIEGVLEWNYTPMKWIVFGISMKGIRGSAAVKDVLILILIYSQVKILSLFT